MALKGSEKIGYFDETKDLWNLPTGEYWISDDYHIYFVNDVDDPEYWFGTYVRKSLDISQEVWENADEGQISQWFEEWYDNFDITDIDDIVVSIGDAYDTEDNLVMDIGIMAWDSFETVTNGEEYFHIKFASKDKYADALEWAKLKGLNEAEKLVAERPEKGYAAILISDYLDDPDGIEVERHNL